MNTEIVRSSNLGPSAFGLRLSAFGLRTSAFGLRPSALGPARNVQNNKLGLKSRAQPEGLGLTLPLGLARPGSAGVTSSPVFFFHFYRISPEIWDGWMGRMGRMGRFLFLISNFLYIFSFFLFPFSLFIFEKFEIRI